MIPGRVCPHYRQNMQMAALFCLVFYASVAIASPAVTFNQINNITTPIIGVSLISLLMAFAGSLTGFAHMPPLENRQKLYTLVCANAYIGACVVVLLPEWRGWTISDVAQPPLAGIISALNVVIVPAVFKSLPAVVKTAMSALGDAVGRFFNRQPKPPSPEGGE